MIYASQLFNSEIIERVAAGQCIYTRRAERLLYFFFFSPFFFFLFFHLHRADRQLRDCDQRSEPITRPFVLISIIHTRFASSVSLARFAPGPGQLAFRAELHLMHFRDSRNAIFAMSTADDLAKRVFRKHDRDEKGGRTRARERA